MGTKNNPGRFDCYAKAEPDEPMFILLGRDHAAAKLIRLWIAYRTLEGEDPAKLLEAAQCAEACERYHLARCAAAGVQRIGEDGAKVNNGI